jgi:hypothetical protein
MMRNLNLILIKNIVIFVLSMFFIHSVCSFFPVVVPDPVVIEERTSEELPGMCDTIPFMESQDVYAGRTETSEKCEYNSLGLPKERFWLTAREWKGIHLKSMEASTQEKRLIMGRFKTWKACHISEFIEHMGQAAQEECKTFPELKPSLIIAQSLIESNFGLSRLAIQGHNLFGHKYRGQKEGFIVAADDSPTDKFTRFKSEWFSLRSHSYLLMRRYRKRITAKTPTLDDWLTALCGGMTTARSKKYVDNGGSVYATSCFTNVCYAQKLKRIIKHYKLNRFD